MASASSSLSIAPPPHVTLSISQKAMALLPVGILVVAFTTIVASYHATFATDILSFQQGRVTTPPISLLMMDGPGRFYGQVGFPLVALLFLSVVPTFYSLLAACVELRPHPILHLGLFATSVLAFLSLSVVGLVPLQRDLVQVMRGTVVIGWDSVIHQTSALILFVLSAAHMGMWLRLTCICNPEAPIHRKHAPTSFLLKLACLVCSIFPLPAAMLIHPVSPLRRKFQLTEHDFGGIMQYAFVACLSIFFASYSMELWYLQQHVLQRQAQPQPLTPNDSSTTTEAGADGKKQQ